MKVFFKILLGGLIYLISNIFTGLIWPLKEEITAGIAENEVSLILPAMLVVGVIFSAVLYFFSSKSRLTLKKRIIVLTPFFYSTVIFMSQIETWYFRVAFPILDNTSLANLFITGLISTIIYVPVILVIFNHKHEGQSKEDFPSKISIVRTILLAVFYIAVYFFFGTFVAYSSPELRNFYSGWGEVVSLQKNLWLFQLFRGVLWAIFAWIGIGQFKKAKDGIIGITIFYGLALTILLIIPNATMPSGVRLFHGIELFLSMVIYGFIAGVVLTSKIMIPRFLKKN